MATSPNHFIVMPNEGILAFIEEIIVEIKVNLKDLFRK